VGGGYVFVGRKIVDEVDPVKAAKAAGFEWAKVIDRKNFSSPFSSCGHDFVTFKLLAARPESSSETVTVCCPAWYGACQIVQ
jgi:hypothetical protein